MEEKQMEENLPIQWVEKQEPQEPVMYAWYSPSVAADYGTVIYRTPDGREVECTSVGVTRPQINDIVDRGPVVEYVRGVMNYERANNYVMNGNWHNWCVDRNEDLFDISVLAKLNSRRAKGDFDDEEKIKKGVDI